jgi:hypothetical protein
VIDRRRQVGTQRLVEDQRDFSWSGRQDLGFSEGRAGPPMPVLLSPPESGFDPLFYLGASPSDAQFWQEMHWEGISDMLLGMETRKGIM